MVRMSDTEINSKSRYTDLHFEAVSSRSKAIRHFDFEIAVRLSADLVDSCLSACLCVL